jgi:hypothetical protein
MKYLNANLYTCFRPNQEQLRQMQLYIGSLAGIEPAAMRFDSTLIFSQLENEKN